MRKKYKKGDKIYEEGGIFQEDEEIGSIKKSDTGDWIETPSGGYGGKYKTNLRGDEHIVITESGLNEDKGYVIKEKQFGKGYSYSEFPVNEKKRTKKYRRSRYSSTSMIDSVDSDDFVMTSGIVIYLIGALVFFISYLIMLNEKESIISILLGTLFWPFFVLVGKQHLAYTCSIYAFIGVGTIIAIIVLFFVIWGIIDDFRRR